MSILHLKEVQNMIYGLNYAV